ncbi:MAG: hypothetical protein OXH79_15275 [Boseongicola sp.]|nr:hypothetical protein [Boseongicola sp.]
MSDAHWGPELAFGGEVGALARGLAVVSRRRRFTQLETRPRMSERSRDFDATTVSDQVRPQGALLDGLARDRMLREPMCWSLPALARRLYGRQLGECPAAELAVTTEAPDAPVPVVAIAAAPKCMHRQETGHLREDRLAGAHVWSSPNRGIGWRA